ncbi:MAG: hypothetical protein KME54_28225 [Tolypothrix brevis GSE-NOS-MK-07-07A]|nr:hypothetical protein [Tolypothrix brevis GSE-NOS-MK-07-07A]
MISVATWNANRSNLHFPTFSPSVHNYKIAVAKVFATIEHLGYRQIPQEPLPAGGEGFLGWGAMTMGITTNYPHMILDKFHPANIQYL